MNKLTVIRILDFITSVAGWFLIVSCVVASIAIAAIAAGMTFHLLSTSLVLSAMVGGTAFVVILIVGLIDSFLF